MLWAGAVVLVLLPLAGGFIGASLFNTGIYKNSTLMDKPDWAPPAWLFSPVWIVLYLAIGVASVLVVRQGANWHTVTAMSVYAVHLLANWAWTPLFFGKTDFAAVSAPRTEFISHFQALVVIASVLSLSVALFFMFLPVSRAASAIFVPYIAWLMFATMLNYEIVTLNGPRLNWTKMINGTGIGEETMTTTNAIILDD